MPQDVGRPMGVNRLNQLWVRSMVYFFLNGAKAVPIQKVKQAVSGICGTRLLHVVWDCFQLQCCGVEQWLQNVL